jgi:hypothetical protein
MLLQYSSKSMPLSVDMAAAAAREFKSSLSMKLNLACQKLNDEMTNIKAHKDTKHTLEAVKES